MPESSSPLIGFIRRVAGAGPLLLTDAQLLENFTRRRDETAFATLVQRHGPMVWAVCKRVLHDPAHAEDAFQATFLVLIRKAHAVGKPQLLANWLYGVAYRTALKARAEVQRRRTHERQVIPLPPPEPPDLLAEDEMSQVLHEEIGRLPARYRDPFVLFHLQDQPMEEVAQRLGCPKNTVGTRLARARQRLRTRLLRRGIAVSVAGFASLLSQNGNAGTVPAGVLENTVHSGLLVAQGGTAAATATAPAAMALSSAVMRSMWLSRARLFVGVLLLVGLAGVGVGVVSYRAFALEPSPSAEADLPGLAAITPREFPLGPQGLWHAIFMEREGTPVSAALLKEKGFRLAIDGDYGKACWTDEREPASEFKFKLYPAKNPHEVDITWLIGSFPGQTVKGIYEMERNTIRVCFSQPGEPRPTRFAGKGKCELMVFERDQ